MSANGKTLTARYLSAHPLQSGVPSDQEEEVWAGPRFWIVVFAFFLGLGLLDAAQAYVNARFFDERLEWRQALLATIPFWSGMAILLPGVVWVSRRLPLDRHRPLSFLPHIPLSFVYGAGHLALGLTGVFLLRGLPFREFVPQLVRVAYQFLVMGILLYWCFLGIAYAVEVRKKLHEKERAARKLELRAAQLESSLGQATLDALRAQLNPHFLFNTLNGISVLAARGEGESVVKMLRRLSDFLRITIDRREPITTVDEELQFVDHYLEIERLRFGDRLLVKKQVDPEARQVSIPTLLLQPLVENALKHAVARTTDTVTVEVGASVEGQTLILWVSDSGPGFTEDPLDSDGLGLRNTRQRLEQLYGEGFRLEFSPPGESATVFLALPVQASFGPEVAA